MAEQLDTAIFVSSVTGSLVTRHGSHRLIGAEVTPGGIPVWNIDQVVAIPREEYDRYLHEYSTELRDGALVRRTRDDYDAYQAAQVAPAPVGG